MDALRTQFFRKLAREQGFSLIEIMVALLVFSVVSTGVAGSLIIGLSSTVRSRHMTMAQFAAQHLVEDMRSRPYFVPYSDDPGIGTTTDIDFLGHYFPGTNTNVVTGADGWDGWYEVIPGDAYYTRVSPPDSNNISLRVVTRFIDNELNVITPTTYNANLINYDYPPSNLAKVTVTASWTDKDGPQEFTLDSIVSGDASGRDSCVHASNSYIDVGGGNTAAASGTNLLFINLGSSLFSGSLGDAHAATSYGCVTSLSGGANGIIITSGINTYEGSATTVTGPPAANSSTGQMTVSKSTWPTLSATSAASGTVSSAPPMPEAAAQGDLQTTSAAFNLQQVDGLGQIGSAVNCTLGALLGGNKCWDFINPVLSIGGTPVSDIKATLDQSNGSTEANGLITYPQINILPLQEASLLAAPDALQGVMFFRNLTIESTTVAGSIGNAACPGSAPACSSLTYSATVGMFNPNAPSSCTGDACYNLYYIDQDHPLQSVIDLSNTTLFLIQNKLFTQFSSVTAGDISAGASVSPDGTMATLNVSDIISVQAQVGDGLTLGGLLTLLNSSGAIQVNIGSVDASVVQQ